MKNLSSADEHHEATGADAMYHYPEDLQVKLDNLRKWQIGWLTFIIFGLGVQVGMLIMWVYG